MKMKVETFMHVDPKHSPEKQAEVRKVMEEYMKGAMQNEKGKMRSDIVEGFLKLFPSEQVKDLEEQIRQLHILENPKKFRAELIILLIRMYFGGLMSDAGAKDEMRKLLKLDQPQPPFPKAKE